MNIKEKIAFIKKQLHVADLIAHDHKLDMANEQMKIKALQNPKSEAVKRYHKLNEQSQLLIKKFVKKQENIA